MDKMLTAKQIALIWGIPDNQVTRYCREARINGAKKAKGVWYIPEDAQKPSDGRKARKTPKVNIQPVRKPLPIGVSNYSDACKYYYYVDK